MLNYNLEYNDTVGIALSTIITQAGNKPFGLLRIC